jgi:nitrous oxidase accessory protein NosD
MDRRPLLLALTLAALTALATISSVSVASRPNCLVVNARTGQHFATLQPAVDATTPGDTLRVKDTCYGDTTVINTKLFIGGEGRATLNGANNGQNPGYRMRFLARGSPLTM